VTAPVVEVPDEQRELLSRLSSDLQTAESRLFTQVESTFKWLMATLWASNGGALVACIGADRFANRLGALPFVLFVIGLVLSIVMGLTNLIYAYAAIGPTSELKNIFVIGAATGQFAQPEVEPLTIRIKRSMVFKWPLWACGIGSLILFVAGAVVTAERIWH
jgi:hypothetical protein